MELSERCIAQLEKEGFLTIYEEQLAAAAPLIAPPTTPWTVLVTEGFVQVSAADTTLSRRLGPGERYRATAHDQAQLSAGPTGCQVVIGHGRNAPN